VQNDDYIFSCIIKYFQGTISPEDASILDKWKKESTENEKEFSQIILILEYADRINQLKRINCVDDLRLVKKRFSENKTTRLQQIGRSAIKYAALLTLPLLIGTLWGVSQYFRQLQMTQSVVTKETQTAFGVHTKVELSDGTLVWLNSGSKLTYPETFTQSAREVTLEGEGYFKVKSDQKHPFYVNVGTMSIKATGTAFNVTNYPNEAFLQVLLEHGKLELVRKVGKSDQQICRIHEGEMLKYQQSSNSICVKKVDVNKYTSWTRGKLIFRNDKMDEVITRIGRQYNAEIHLEGEELKDYRYTATFEDETLFQILDLLRHSSPITYTIEPRKKQTDETFSKQIITIKEKRKKNQQIMR